MTALGKSKFLEYVAELERVIADAAKLRTTEIIESPAVRVATA